MTRDEIDQLITDCENRSERLNDWELGFIDSIRRQFDASGSLSPKQIERLEEVWERVT